MRVHAATKEPLMVAVFIIAIVGAAKIVLRWHTLRTNPDTTAPGWAIPVLGVCAYVLLGLAIFAMASFMNWIP